MMHEDCDHPLSSVDDGRSPMFESEEKERGNSIRQRHDRGPRLISRDVTCLLWSAQQVAIRLDQLQRLLLRHTPERDRAKGKAGADRLPPGAHLRHARALAGARPDRTGHHTPWRQALDLALSCGPAFAVSKWHANLTQARQCPSAAPLLYQPGAVGGGREAPAGYLEIGARDQARAGPSGQRGAAAACPRCACLLRSVLAGVVESDSCFSSVAIV